MSFIYPPLHSSSLSVVVVKGAVKSQLTYSNPIWFVRQETFRVGLPLSASASQP